MNYNIETSLGENEQFSSFLQEKVKEFNNKHSEHHREIRKKGAIQPINIIVSDEEGRWLGGIHADVYWNWVEINYLWIRDDFRGKGLGSQLLERAEKLAKKLGARKALLTTCEFQARSFYEIHDYQVAGEIKDYPPGSCYYTMVKTLS